MTLKEIRESRGLTQGAISQISGINIPTLSNYEAGNSVPTLEDVMRLEELFNQPIDWKETYKPKVAASILTLMQYYPLSTVINFAARCLKTEYGDTLIIHYAELAEKRNDPKDVILMPPGNE